MNDYLTILGQVLTGFFGPWFVLVLGVVVFFASVIWASFTGSREARSGGMPVWVTVVSWLLVVVLFFAGIALVLFVGQFNPFAWELLE